MPPLEIERKYLLQDVPPGYEEGDHVPIAQGYTTTGVRYRKKGERYFRTVKHGSGLVREEDESEISREEFVAAWPETEGRRLEKLRTNVPLENGLVAEVDIFLGGLAGLQLVEVEFPNVEMANSFTPPAWFGPEVTDDPRYKNSTLAREGLPKAES